MTKPVAAAGRQVPCDKCPLRGLDILRKFSPEELAFVSEFKSGELTAQPGTTLFLQGTNAAHLYTMLAGWAFRYKTLADGRRQILNFVLPGDFIGLQGSIMNEMQHSVETLTDSVLCIFPRDKLWNRYTGYPALAVGVTGIAARQEQTVHESLLSVGRRSALERMADVLLHVVERMEVLGMV